LDIIGHVNIAFTSRHRRLIEKKVQSGQYNSAAEVVREAMRLLEAHEERATRLATLQQEIEKGFSSPTTPWTKKDAERVRQLVERRGKRRAA
jgi:putative addiction module CopG family antidote